jgi:hypothetical protein
LIKKNQTDKKRGGVAEAALPRQKTAERKGVAEGCSRQ